MLEAALRRTADKGQSDRQIEAERQNEAAAQAVPDPVTPPETEEDVRIQGPESPAFASPSSEASGVKRVRFDESQDVVEIDDAIEEETGICLAEEEDDEIPRTDKRPAEDNLDRGGGSLERSKTETGIDS